MDSEEQDYDIKSIFLQRKPTDMIVTLKLLDGLYASELSSKCDTTYSHAVKVMNRMHELLVQSKKLGRKKEYSLTEKGMKVADHFLELFDEVEGMERPLENANGGSISDIV